MSRRSPAAVVVVVAVLSVAGVACGPRDATSAADPEPAPAATSTAVAGSPTTSDEPVEAEPGEPDIEELERVLDDIDQLLTDLELDLDGD